MKKRTLIFALTMLILPMVLVACGGGLDEGELEDALEKAFNDGDVGDLNDLVCEDEQVGAAEFAVPFEVDSVDCSVDDSDVECDITVAAEGQTVDLTLAGTVDDDDKLCDITLPQMEAPAEIPTIEATTDDTGGEATEATEGEDTPAPES
ncbi:MAG: hypothetical protein L0154_26745 [Chloroflexi bacterium]|nr:hypothetical protein [Chloroflexota bacterium]